MKKGGKSIPGKRNRRYTGMSVEMMLSKGDQRKSGMSVEMQQEERGDNSKSPLFLFIVKTRQILTIVLLNYGEWIGWDEEEANNQV